MSEIIKQENGHFWMSLSDVFRIAQEYCIGRNIVDRDAILYYLMETQGLEVERKKSRYQYKYVRTNITMAMNMMSDFDKRDNRQSSFVWDRRESA
jgi:hypothetical protein